jgi:hypothetical protein
MTLRTWSVLLGTLVALLAASVFLWQRPVPDTRLMALHTDGIGPLRLGRDYPEAVEAVRRTAAENMLAGPGCGELDEVRYSDRLGEFPVSVMAMADDGVLVEIELGLDSPLQADDEAACVALRDRFGEAFAARFGPFEEHQEIRKPVSREHVARSGPVVLVARWFDTGRSCYISAHYGYRDDG